MEFQQQKRKCLADFEEQRHHIIGSLKTERKESELEFKKQLDLQINQADLEREHRIKEIDDLRRKNSIEFSQLREKLAVEKEEWQGMYMKKLEDQMKIREKSLKDRLVKERDAEIELVIMRLETETDLNHTDASRSARFEIQKIKAENANQIKDIKDQHGFALDEILNLKSQLDTVNCHKIEAQKQILIVEHQLTAKEVALKQQQIQLDRLQVNEEVLAQTIRNY